MGRRGPQPEPNQQRIAKGETRPSQLNLDAPLPRTMEPVRPPGLNDAASAVWDRVVGDAPPGMLTSIDSDLLRMYCETIAHYALYRPAYDRAPLLPRGFIEGPDPEHPGKTKQYPVMVKSPLHQVIRDSIDIARVLARELGFSPAARMGMHMAAAIAAGHAAPGDDIDDLIGRPARLRIIEGRGSEVEDD